jgi:hypothetical protein
VLRNFDPAYDRYGSKAAEMIGTMGRPMSEVAPKADIDQGPKRSGLYEKTPRANEVIE